MKIEGLLVVIAFLAAAWPFRRLLRRRRGLALTTLGLMALLVLVSARAHEGAATERETLAAARDRVTPIVHEEDGYVGSDACQSCHPGEHASWQRTYHRTMTQRATPETVLGDFDDRSISDRGRSYRMQREGDRFFVELVDPDWDWFEGRGARAPIPEGVAAPRVRREIVMVTGSHDTQVYWMPGHHDDRRLNFFPLVWKIETARWIPLGDAFLKYPESVEHLALWNRTCATCHSTGLRVRAGDGSASNTVPMNTAVAELGISCEACHGPGAEHVAANENPLRRYEMHLGGAEAGDPTIVNPARLDHERSAEVCGQCHGMAFLLTRPEIQDRHGAPYRPGDDLDESRIMQDPSDPRQRRYWQETLKSDPVYLLNHFWKDGMARVSGRDYTSMRRSACFTRGELSCLHCHSMHDSDPDDMLVRDRPTDRVCMDCHEEEARDSAAHSRHAAGSSGDSCIACHMPAVTYGLLKGIRNHQIASPSTAEELDHGRPNACTLCHLDRSLAWTQDALVKGWGQTPRPLDEDRRRFSSAVLMALRGDAGQRALVANAMGDAAHRAASGADWMVPILAELLDDPYGAVRYIAERSLRRLDGWRDFEYDMLAPSAERRRVVAALQAAWRTRRDPELRRGPEVLQDERGLLLETELRRLLAERDMTRLALGE